MVQAPEVTGGAGFSFEDACVAIFLTALLGEESSPGLSNRIVKRVALQQAAFGEPLDDVAVDAVGPDETVGRLSLQVKRALTISAAKSNEDFRETIERAWQTVLKSDFREGIDRVGFAVGTISGGPRRAFIEVCEWARDSETAEAFAARFETSGIAGADRRSAHEAVTAILTEKFPGSGNSECFRLLKHFVAIQFDFLHEGATDEAAAIERLRLRLSARDAGRAADLWFRLQTIARLGAGRSAVFTRSSLIQDLQGAFRFAAARSWSENIRRINEETHLSLVNIPSDIAGTQIERPALTNQVAEAVRTRRFVQLVGQPGTGKSAALRSVAEETKQDGTILVLKSDRLTGPNWAAYARAIGLSNCALEALLEEIEATGSPIVFIDGIDRVEVQNRGIVSDLVLTILGNPALSNWSIVATSRDNGIEPLRTWLPPGLWSQAGIASIEVQPFNDEEATALAEAKPQLRRLLFGEKRVRDIARRPFFASVLVRAFADAAPDAAPQSEIELIEAWWRRGGYDSEQGQASRRQRLLIVLAKAGAATLGRRIRVDGMDVEALASLKRDGIVKDVREGHSVQFSHDIFFEWSFLHLLIDVEDAWITEIQAVGEPPVLGRTVELLSQATFAAYSEWERVIQHLETANARPQWLRAWLTGPFGWPRFFENVEAFTNAMLRDDGRRLAKLIVWFQAEKTRSNPRVLDRSIYAQPAEPREVIRMADMLAWPSDVPTWNRFCSWLLNNLERCPISVVPDLLSAFEVWQNIFGNVPNRVSAKIIAAVNGWLEDIEDREHGEEFGYRRGPWSDLEGDEIAELEGRLRSALLRSARIEVDRVHAYLERVRRRPRLRDHAFQKILPWTPVLALNQAQDIVALSLEQLVDDLPTELVARRRTEPFSPDISMHDWHDLSIGELHGWYTPPSPLREPFPSLFKSAPDEALALVRKISNHAITAWRQLHELAPAERGTPIPLCLEFPWGTATFWGNGQVYVWPRGEWAPDPVASGLMALENWAFEEVTGGRAVDDVIRDVVSGHDSCAVLSIGVALALESNRVSEVTLPLVTSQVIWERDVERLVLGAGTNLFGFTSPSPHVEAVRTLNSRPSRRTDIRSLAPLFVLSSNDKLRIATQEAIQSFPDNLPFDYEEEKQSPTRVAKLRRNAEIWSHIGRPELYFASPAPDGSGTLIGLQNPTASDPDVIATVQRSARMNEQFGTISWITDTIKQQAVSLKLSLDQAIAVAKKLDHRRLFKEPHNADFDRGLDQAVVAGVAAVLARYVDGIDRKNLTWSAKVLFRAARTPERQSNGWFAGSAIPHHPSLFSVTGLSGLIRRGHDKEKAEASLLALAGHPLEGVSQAALTECFGLWDVEPNLSWIALDVAIRLSVGSRDNPISPYGYDQATQPVRIIKAIELAIDNLGKDQMTLADIPAPWVFAPPSERFGSFRGVSNKPVWREPDEFLRWDFLPKVFSALPAEALMDDYSRRPAFLKFCYDLLDWTLEKLNPSWEEKKEKRSDRRGSNLYRWRDDLARLLARVALKLEPEGSRTRILEPIFALDDEQAASFIEPFAGWIAAAGIVDAKDISPQAIPLMTLCLERILKDRAWRSARNRNGTVYGSDLPTLIREFLFVSVEYAGGACRFANRDWREVGTVLPIIDRFVRAVGDIPSVMSAFLTLCERAAEHYPASTFVDQILAVIGQRERTPVGWRDTVIPSRIAGLIHTFAEQSQPLSAQTAQSMLRILDRLVDMGDRRSAALQTSEIFKDVRV